VLKVKNYKQLTNINIEFNLILYFVDRFGARASDLTDILDYPYLKNIDPTRDNLMSAKNMKICINKHILNF
jgi:hypothetical protein